MAEMELSQEWRGLPAPPGVTIPSATTIKTICDEAICAEATERRYPMSLAYPPGEEPTLWIKYGCAVSWEEVVHQFRAHQELRNIDSPVRVPAIYYACQDNVAKETYIVMEYIRGNTVNSLILKSHESPGQSLEIQEAISRRVAFALEEFLRIPVPFGSPPASVSGGLIRHPLFQESEAPRAYDNAEQLEQHLNLVGYILHPYSQSPSSAEQETQFRWKQFIELPGLRKIRRNLPLVRGLSQEPMVFCYSDLNGGNFIINDKDEIIVVDFSELSILPVSFAKYLLLVHGFDGLGPSVRPWVHFPDTGGESDNASVLVELQFPMIQSCSFERVAHRVPGGDCVNE